MQPTVEHLKTRSFHTKSLHLKTWNQQLFDKKMTDTNKNGRLIDHLIKVQDTLHSDVLLNYSERLSCTVD